MILDVKLVIGDWNGVGVHTNFFIWFMCSEGGLDVIKVVCEKLRNCVFEYFVVYGEGYELRFIGWYETCCYDEFKYGVGDRIVLVRIPVHVVVDF